MEMSHRIILKQLELERDEVKQTRQDYEISCSKRKFAYAALATSAICLGYGLAKFLFDIDIPNNSYFSPEGAIFYMGLVSGVVGGFGLMRRHDEIASTNAIANSAKDNLDELMIKLAKIEYRENINFDIRNKRKNGYE